MKTIIITLGSIPGEGIRHSFDNVTCLGDAITSLQNVQPLAKLSDITAVETVDDAGRRPYQFKENDHRLMIDWGSDIYESVDRFKAGIISMHGGKQ